MLGVATFTSTKHIVPYVASNLVPWLKQTRASGIADLLVANRQRVNAVSRQPDTSYSSTTLPWAWVSPSYQSQRKTVFLGSLNDSRLALTVPLTVDVYTSPDVVAAYCLDLDELAIGDTEDEAIEDMRAMVADSYFLLKENQSNLGRLQRAHWNFLRGITKERAT